MSLTRFIWKFVKAQPFIFTCILILCLCWALEILLWPFFLRILVDLLTRFETHRTDLLPLFKKPLLYGALLWTFMESCFRFKDFLTSKAFPKMESAMRMSLFDHVQRHSPRYFNEHFSGSLANKIGDMVLSSSSMLRCILKTFIPSLLICFITAAIFAKVNLFFGLIVTGWILIHLALSWLFTLKCKHYSYLHGEARNDLIGKVVDTLSQNFAVNLFFRFDFEKERIGSAQKIEQEANQKAQMYNTAMFSTLSLAFVLEISFLSWLIFIYWIDGALSTGQVVQLFYTIWNVAIVIFNVADEAPVFFQSMGIAKQALSVMNDPQDILDNEGALDLNIKRGEIVFENVSFSYKDQPIFENKNITIRSGEKVGLVGYSGAGKSTFVNLILRFFSIQKGRILIDGQDIAHVTLESLRKNVALIPQDPMLFHRTLEENICYGKLDYSETELKNATKNACIDDVIQRHPLGYKALVGERGTKLSGGERQRIAIARAFLLKAPILILDEATSALDSVTENHIQESLEKLMEKRTTIVIAHRLSTLSKMDRILVFDKGKIIEEGSHFELLNKKGHYAHMWQMQAGGFLPDTPLS